MCYLAQINHMLLLVSSMILCACFVRLCYWPRRSTTDLLHRTSTLQLLQQQTTRGYPNSLCKTAVWAFDSLTQSSPTGLLQATAVITLLLQELGLIASHGTLAATMTSQQQTLWSPHIMHCRTLVCASPHPHLEALHSSGQLYPLCHALKAGVSMHSSRQLYPLCPPLKAGVSMHTSATSNSRHRSLLHADIHPRLMQRLCSSFIWLCRRCHRHEVSLRKPSRDLASSFLIQCSSTSASLRCGLMLLVQQSLEV